MSSGLFVIVYAVINISVILVILNFLLITVNYSYSSNLEMLLELELFEPDLNNVISISGCPIDLDSLACAIKEEEFTTREGFLNYIFNSSKDSLIPRIVTPRERIYGLGELKSRVTNRFDLSFFRNFFINVTFLFLITFLAFKNLFIGAVKMSRQGSITTFLGFLQ